MKKTSVVYRCPHCDQPIREVNVILLSSKQIALSAALGFGIGLFTYPLFGHLSALGGFVVAFLITFLFLRRK